MPKKPVIVLTFSNDNDGYLSMIIEERKNIFKALQTHQDEGYVQVHKEESTSLKDLTDLFTRYRDRIVIFHYGGHAGDTHLQLETSAGEQQRAHAEGLAQLLGQQKQLQLVFLNGCATLKQVDMLLSFGVGAVIATSVLIGDKMATKFAEHFYNALASQATIQEAFDTAKGSILIEYGPSKEIDRYFRRVLREKIEKPLHSELPWGLYCDESRPEILEWKLPTYNCDSVTICGSDISYPDDEQLNNHLIATLIDEITQYGVSRPNEKDPRYIRQKVIDSFPFPVGKQLQVLFTDNTNPPISTPRLKQLVITYNTVIQLLCFTLLSQLWDALFENPALVIHEDHLVEINSFFDLAPGNYPTYDYFKLIETMAKIFEKNHIDCFIEEFNAVKESFRDRDQFYKAYLFMEKMKRKVKNDNVNANEIQDFCIQANEHLGTILKKLAFLVRYQLTSIKRIEVMKLRHKKANFQHNIVILDKISLYLSDTFELDATYKENNAVILMKNVGDEKGYLNLSPFIIDENTLTGNKYSKLFFYSHQEMKDGKPCYLYKFSDDPEDKFLEVSDKKYMKVKEQFDEFKENILR